MDANGNVDHFNVRKGTVTVGPSGIDTKDQNSLDIIARGTDIYGDLS